jgi:hypothetical protein
MLRRTVLAAPLTAFAPQRRYRACIIGHTGRGNYGHDWHTAFAGLPNVEVAAVADPVEQGRLAAMKASRAARGYADYREMLGKEKPDLVGIFPRFDAIESGREPVCSAADGRWTIEMVTGIYQSQIFGRPVEFPLKDRRNPLAG